MSISAGQVVYVKTTNEPVFVLELREVSEKWQNVVLDRAVFSGMGAIVRIPLMLEATGIAHKVNTFLVEELETEDDRERKADERRQREMDTIEKMNDEARRRAEAITPVSKPN